MGIFDFITGGGEPDPTSPTSLSRATRPVDAAPEGTGTVPGTCSVELVSAGGKLIKVIKEVREQTGLGLKEAKDLVDAAPSIVAERIDDVSARRIAEALIQAGATARVVDEHLGAGSTAAGSAVIAGAPGTSLELTDPGRKLIEVIKAVRELTGLGLKEAKDLVDSAPSIVLEGATAEQLVAAQVRLQDVGADVTVR